MNLWNKGNVSTIENYRTLSKGQRGEVYEINGDQVAVIFDPLAEKLHDGDNDATSKEENTEASIYWVDCMLLSFFMNSFVFKYLIWKFQAPWLHLVSLCLAQDIVHDHDTESEDWHIAIEALCEVIYQTMYWILVLHTPNISILLLANPM